MSKAKHSVATNYLQALIDRGIEYVFANAGTDFAPIIEALVYCKQNGIRTPEFVTVPHENVAISMAHGYFLATGKPAAVMVHVTVGTANALCGLMNAARDQAPILLTAGRTPSTEKGHIGSRNASIHWGQDSFDQGGTVREWVKWDYELRPGQPAEEIVGRALDIAMSEPKGPVYLCMPREVLGDLTETDPAPMRERALGAMVAAPSTKGIRQAAEWLSEAKFPLVISSSTGRDAANVAKLTRISDKFGIGVALPGEPGARELNIATTHPHYLGQHPAEALKQADVILSIDCEVPWWPSMVDIRADAKLIHIAPDPFFGRYPVRGFQADLALSGSSSIALCKLEDALTEICAGKEAAIEQRRQQFTALSAARSKDITALMDKVKDEFPLHPAWIARCINEIVDEDTVIINELGVPLDFLFLEHPRSYLSSSLAGGLGFGLGASLGVKMGNKAKKVLLLVGDGSYMFGCPTATHHTAKLHGLPTTTLVMNNARWHAVHRSTLGMYPDGLASKEAPMPLVSLGDSPEYHDIMAACGGYGEKIDAPEQLPYAIKRCLEANAKGQAALLNLITSYWQEQRKEQRGLRILSIETLLTFSLASMLLTLAPGPDNLFVMMQSALFGRKAGIFITLGLCTGLLVHTALVACGVAVLFQVSDVAFTILKIAGASYLFYLAFHAFKQLSRHARVGSQPRLTTPQLYLRGVVMNLSNPKVLIFFLAFLPQFTNPEQGNIAFQIILLGVIFVVIALVLFILFSILAVQLANWLRHSRWAEQVLQGLALVVYLALALRLTLATA